MTKGQPPSKTTKYHKKGQDSEEHFRWTFKLVFVLKYGVRPWSRSPVRSSSSDYWCMILTQQTFDVQSSSTPTVCSFIVRSRHSPVRVSKTRHLFLFPATQNPSYSRPTMCSPFVCHLELGVWCPGQVSFCRVLPLCPRLFYIRGLGWDVNRRSVKDQVPTVTGPLYLVSPVLRSLRRDGVI